MSSSVHSLRFRLTMRYALAFAVSLVLVFVVLDWFLAVEALRQSDSLLMAEAQRAAYLAGRRKVRILQAEFDRFARFHGADRVMIRMLDRDGGVVAASQPSAWNAEDFPLPAVGTVGTDAPRRQTAFVRGERVRSVYLSDETGGLIHVACSLRDGDTALSLQRRVLFVGLALSLLVGTAYAGRAAGRVITRVNDIRRTAASIAAGDLSQRVPAGPESDELRDLGDTFNAMLSRTEALIVELRRVTDNIAHELRTPITRMRGTMESALAPPGTETEMRHAGAVVLEECDRLARTITVMLQIARLESGRERLPRAPVDVKELILGAVEAFETLADEKAQRIETALPETSVRVAGDRPALQRMLANLLDNAIKYTPRGGDISITCRQTGASVELAVADTGIGISAPDLPHIFERFYRAAQVRGEQGSGLGLCLVHSIVLAHGGDVRAESKAGNGSRFVVRLPGAT